jgi:hypothetical protein
MGRVKCDHIKRLITLTSDNIKRLSLYFPRDHLSPAVPFPHELDSSVSYTSYLSCRDVENAGALKNPSVHTITCPRARANLIYVRVCYRLGRLVRSSTYHNFFLFTKCTSFFGSLEFCA